MSLSKILKGTQSKEIGKYLLASTNDFFGLGIEITRECLQILETSSWRTQEEKNLCEQVFTVEPACSESPGQKLLGPSALPSFRFWRAAANSAGEKAPAIEELLDVRNL